MILGSSSLIIKQIDRLQIIKSSNVNCIIVGDVGTGKKLFLKNLIDNKEYININCKNKDSINIFGDQNSNGLIEKANNKICVLKNIDRLNIEEQKRIYQIIFDKYYFKINCYDPTYLNIEFITTTEININEYIEKGFFRKDLFDLLKIGIIELPRLNNRLEDINELAENFVQQLNKKYNKNIKYSKASYKILEKYNYEYNIDELRNIIEFAFFNSETTINEDSFKFLYSEDNFKQYLFDSKKETKLKQNEFKLQISGYGTEFVLIERQYWVRIMNMAGWKIEPAKRLSGKSRPYIKNVLRRLKIKKYEKVNQ